MDSSIEEIYSNLAYRLELYYNIRRPVALRMAHEVLCAALHDAYMEEQAATAKAALEGDNEQ